MHVAYEENQKTSFGFTFFNPFFIFLAPFIRPIVIACIAFISAVVNCRFLNDNPDYKWPTDSNSQTTNIRSK